MRIVLNVAIALAGLCLFTSLLFGVVAVLNWHAAYNRFEGQPYHATSFQVTRPYYQRSAGMHGPDIAVYAKGLVEGQEEWMGLIPYLKRMPSGQDELNNLVPRGTVIPVNLFPGLTGQRRIQLIGALPQAELNHQAEMAALRQWSIAAGGFGALVLVLVGVRRFLPSRARENFDTV
jgi:hypothetical protein